MTHEPADPRAPAESGSGFYALGDERLALLHGLDAVVLDWAREVGAAPRHYPTLISTETMLRTDYYATFPSQATFACHAVASSHETLKTALAERRLEGALALPEMQLRPALCYHVYEELAGSTLGGELVAFTVLGTCFRHESETASLRRQREFTMREIVFAGPPDALVLRRSDLREKSVALARELGLDVDAEVATDPFFGSSSRGRSLYQKARQLKWELTQTLSDGTALAIASLNLHEDYFANAFGIRLDASRPAATACNGWGYERWIAAIVDRHGERPADWPRSVRELVDRGAAACALGGGAGAGDRARGGSRG